MTGIRKRLSPRRALTAVLILQLALAGLLIVSDISFSQSFPYQPRVDLPSGPISPGDQRREYRVDQPRPGFLMPRTPVVLPRPDNMPRHLQFDTQEIDGLGLVMSITGKIEQGDLFRLQGFLEGLDAQPDLVALNSPGGSVYEALEIGHSLRDRAFNVSVLSGSICLSACPYILAGGIERWVSRDSAVGMHQHYFDTPKLLPAFVAVKDIQFGQGKTMEYLIEMGIDTSVMLYSLITPPEEVYLLVEEELSQTKLATRMLD